MPEFMTGDVLTARADLLLFSGNGVVTKRGLVMGAGNAARFAQTYTGLPRELGDLLGVGIHQYGLLVNSTGTIGSFQSKVHWANSSSLKIMNLRGIHSPRLASLVR